MYKISKNYTFSPIHIHLWWRHNAYCASFHVIACINISGAPTAPLRHRTFKTRTCAPGLRPSSHERFFANAVAGMKRSVLNGSERTEGCFAAAFFQTQHAAFSVRCGGRTAFGSGNVTQEHTGLRARAAKQSHSHQSSSAVPSNCTNHGSRLQDFWQWEINKWGGENAGTTIRHQSSEQNTAKKNSGQKFAKLSCRIGAEWTQEWQKVKSVKNHFYVQCNLFVETVEYLFIIFL